jgi:hypothetical protein
MSVKKKERKKSGGLDITFVNTATACEEEGGTKAGHARTRRNARGSSLSHRLEALELVHVTLQRSGFPAVRISGHLKTSGWRFGQISTGAASGR